MIKHNYVAIAVMVVAHMVFGFLWYGVIFMETWSQAALGKSAAEVQQMEGSPVPYIINIIATAFSCFFISWLVQKLKVTTFAGGLTIGLYAVLGLVLPVIAIHYVFLQISNTVLILDVLMSAIVTMLTFGILAVWRKK